MLFSHIAVGLGGWQLGKVIGIFQMLIYFVKPLIDLTSFPYLGHAYNLDSIKNIISNKQD